MQGQNHIIFAQSSTSAEWLASLYFRACLPIAYIWEPGAMKRLCQFRETSLKETS